MLRLRRQTYQQVVRTGDFVKKTQEGMSGWQAATVAMKWSTPASLFRYSLPGPPRTGTSSFEPLRLRKSSRFYGCQNLTCIGCAVLPS